MSLQWLPETIVLVACLLAGGIALHLLLSGERRRGAVLGISSIALFVLAASLTRIELSELRGRVGSPARLTPATHAIAEDSHFGTLLRLGDSILQVAHSKHYALSADGKTFLALDVEDEGLTVSGRLSDSQDRPAGRIRRNRLESFPGSTMHIAQPDPHTLLVEQAGVDVLRIRYASPREILITGRFHHPGLSEPVVISGSEGIHWHGGGIPPGLSIDLRHYGPGVVDLERSGLIQVLPGGNPLLPSVASLCALLLHEAALLRI